VVWDRDNVEGMVSAGSLSGSAGAAMVGYDTLTLDAFLLSGANRVVDTIAALRALNKAKWTRAFVTGYYVAGDGGGGAYTYDPTDTTTADNGGTVIVASDGVRWKLNLSGGVASAKQFGAKGDGTTDDTARIQAAINGTPDHCTLRFPAGQYVLIPATSVAYNDKFSVTRKTAIQITSRTNLALLFEAGAKVIVNGTDAERVAFFLKNCTGVTIADPYFPNVSGNTSISGSDYIASENYYPIALEGNNGVWIRGLRTEACRSALMMDVFNGAQNKNVFIDKLFTYQTCNYSVITRNADNVQVTNARMEQTGRSWNTSNEDVAFSDNSINCKAVNCDAIAPLGRVSRFAAGKNVGPTVFDNCRLNGDGIWVEIYEASNVEIIGGYSKRTSERVSSHILFTADIYQNNANVTVTGAQFFGGGLIVSDYYPSGWGAADIEGFVMTGCTAQDTYGIQMSIKRLGCVYKGNRFNLNSSGILLQPGGKGTVFEGNSVKNGYVRIDSYNFKATGNDMTGNAGSPIPFAWDVQGDIGFIERGNTYSAGTYTQFFNHTPSARFGAKYLENGNSSNPQTSLAAYITGVVGDYWRNDNPLDGTPEGWTCVVAGSPGTWSAVGQNGYRTSAGAPSVNAAFVREELLDTTNNKWYKAKNTGTGASDWVALN
jgi:hypothetical protein